MKTIILFSTQKFFFALAFCSAALSLNAQKANVWKGGTPGHERDWFCARNWSGNSVPDEFTDVIIPDVSHSTRATPVIGSGKVAINMLRLESSTLLTIAAEASLLVLGKSYGATAQNMRILGAFQVLEEGYPKPILPSGAMANF
jgi:hypothetical protein